MGWGVIGLGVGVRGYRADGLMGWGEGWLALVTGWADRWVLGGVWCAAFHIAFIPKHTPLEASTPTPLKPASTPP